MVKVKRDGQFFKELNWRVIELELDDDINLSFALGREHGPIIERMGDDSPRMICLEKATGELYTTDPELQRLGCWFIDEGSRAKSLFSTIIYLKYYHQKLEEKNPNTFNEIIEGLLNDIPKLNNDFASKFQSALQKIGKVEFKNNEEKMKIQYPDIKINLVNQIIGVFKDSEFIENEEIKNIVGTIEVLASERRFIKEIEDDKDNSSIYIDRGFKKWFVILAWSLYQEKTKVHTTEVQKRIGRNYTGYQGCGDLSMNLWNVAFINNDGEERKLVYPHEEPVENRTYTCLIKWKQEEKKDKRFEIVPLKFNRFASDNSPDRVRQVQNNGNIESIADKIEFAVSGQQVLKEGKWVDLRSTIMQYSDLRHVFLLPNLNPSYLLDGYEVNENFEIYKDKGRPRTVFDRQQYDDVWLGEHSLLNDRNRRMAALSGPVSFNLNELRATEQLIQAALYAKGKNDKNEGGKSYKRIYDPTCPLQEGQWRKIVEGREIWYEIYFRKNEYPCSMIGTCDDGRVLMFVCKGKYSHRDSWTIEKAAEQFKKTGGVTDALLIDEGGDVYQYLKDENYNLKPGRELVRATFVITQKK